MWGFRKALLLGISQRASSSTGRSWLQCRGVRFAKPAKSWEREAEPTRAMDPEGVFCDGDGLSSLAVCVDPRKEDVSDDEAKAPSEAGRQRKGQQTPPPLTPQTQSSASKEKEKKVKCKCCLKIVLPSDLAVNSPYIMTKGVWKKAAKAAAGQAFLPSAARQQTLC